jgi:hypothetical protein
MITQNFNLDFTSSLILIARARVSEISYRPTIDPEVIAICGAGADAPTPKKFNAG